MKSIGIIGAGWLGKKLMNQLSCEFKVYVTTRSEENADAFSASGHVATVVQFSEEEETVHEGWRFAPKLDVVVVMVPFSLRRSSADALRVRMNNLCSFIRGFKGQLFFASSTSVYPQKVNVFTEKDLPIEENLIEHQIKKRYPQVNILRLGGLMGDDRLLSKYNVPNLQDPVNHIHYADACSLIIRMIEDKVKGTVYNVVAPQHPSKEDVIHAQLNETSPTHLDPKGRIVSSAKLMKEMGFSFKYPDPRTFHLIQ